MVCEEAHAGVHVLALRDVFRDPQHLQRITVEVEQGITFGPQPAEAAVRPCDPVFDIEVTSPAQTLLERLAEFGAILRMQAIQQRGIGQFRLIAANAEQAQAHVGRTYQRTFYIEFAGADFGEGQSQLFPVETGLQCIERAASDVLGIAEFYRRCLQFGTGARQPEVRRGQMQPGLRELVFQVGDALHGRGFRGAAPTAWYRLAGAGSDLLWGTHEFGRMDRLLCPAQCHRLREPD